MSGEMGKLASDANAGVVRDNHRFDELKLREYLRDYIEVGPTFVVRQFSGGQSNPTFLAETAGRKYVIRKKPPGILLKSAHQVDREYRVMKALAQTDVPVPTMRVLCEDEQVIGTSFYVMDFLEGRIFRDVLLPEVSPSDRAEIYDDMNRNMAALHKVDFQAIGLGDFGKPGNYFDRQVARWITQYRGAETENIPAMEELIAWMPTNIPKDDSVSIAHGDYRLENTIYHPTENRIIAVLDWELCTIGHPLADLGYNIMGYRNMHPRQGGLVSADFETSGIPREADYVKAYAERVGRSYPIENLDFYIAFSMFRLASISQGVYKRGLDGNASSENAAAQNGTAGLAEAAARILKIR